MLRPLGGEPSNGWPEQLDDRGPGTTRLHLRHGVGTEQRRRTTIVDAVTTRLPAVVVAAVLCLATSACSSDADPSSSESTVPLSSVGDTQDPTTTAPTTATVESTQPSVPASASSGAPTTAPTGGATAGPIDAMQAIAFAIANTPGDAISIESRTEHDVAVWEVVVLEAAGTAVEYLVSIGTGEILEQKPTSSAATSAPAVSLVQAIEIAAATVPGAPLIDANLDIEEGRVVWDVTLGQPGTGGEVELRIDAETGEVVDQDVKS